MASDTRASQQQSQATLNGPKDLFLSAFPPLRAAIKVLKSPDPLAAAGQENHSWYGVFVALGLIMVFAMLVILAGDGAPFVNPWTSLWTNKFKFNIMPTYNWPILLGCAAYALVACAIGYFTCFIAGLQLSGGVRALRKQAVRLAGYAALGAACMFAVTLLLIFSFGWILYVLKFHIFIFGWMTMASIVVLPVTTWGMTSVFRRTSLPEKSSILLPLTISMATITSSAISAIFIMDHLNEALLKQGHMVNSVRSTPTAAIVQTCARVSTDVICAVTLFPTKWQDYELIGDWQLGNGSQQTHFQWRPARKADRQFALVTVESRKDITVEIRIAANIVCGPDGTNIANDDRFFAVQGRVLGEQQNSPQKIRLLIDNVEPTFAEVMKQVCRSQINA